MYLWAFHCQLLMTSIIQIDDLHFRSSRDRHKSLYGKYPIFSCFMAYQFLSLQFCLTCILFASSAGDEFSCVNRDGYPIHVFGNATKEPKPSVTNSKTMENSYQKRWQQFQKIQLTAQPQPKSPKVCLS